MPKPRNFLPIMAALLAATPAAAQRISPRLLDDGATKAVGGVPALLIPAEGRQLPALPGAVALADGSLLARLTPAALEGLAASGALAYAMPQQPVLIPDDQPETAPGAIAPVGKSVGITARPAGGRGIRIGLIDFGRIAPDNPARARLVGERRAAATAASSHADQVLRIAHAHAPEAEFLVALLPAAPTEQDVLEAADWLAGQGARIINFSGASYGGRRDGRSPIDRLADRLAGEGRLFVTTAGNDARRSWSGPLLDRDGDGQADLPAGGLWLQASGGAVQIQLTWDDWGPVARRLPLGPFDLDLELLAEDGRLIRAAAHRRGLIGEPVESIAISLPPGRYRLRLPLRASGPGQPLVQIVATGAVTSLLPSVAEHSIAIPGTSRSALTVGAADPARGGPAPYSGRGPTLDNRAKPDLLAIATAPGREGTSYAAPRIAGLAARLWSTQPDLPLAALRAAVLAAAASEGE